MTDCCAGYTLTVADSKMPTWTLERLAARWREGTLCHDCYYKVTAEYMKAAWPPLNSEQKLFIGSVS